MTPDDLPDLSAPNRPPDRDSAGNPVTKEPADPVAVAALVVGCVGLVVFGIVLAIVTAVLAGAAGQRARERRTSPENAYLAFGLAALDGIVWIVLHMIFDLNFLAG
jgi:hypothetical protein